MAENRPLTCLYDMVDNPAIKFTQEDFKLQFRVYMRELRRLLDDDEGCKGQYEFFHYRDDKILDFGGAIVAKINSMKLDEYDTARF